MIAKMMGLVHHIKILRFSCRTDSATFSNEARVVFIEEVDVVCVVRIVVN